MKISLNLILLLSSAINCHGTKHFSSLVQLERLGEREQHMIHQLEDIADELNDDYVKKKLEYFRVESKLFRQDAARYIANPLNALAMIKRASVDLSLLMERISRQKPLTRVAEALSPFRVEDASFSHAVKSLLLIQRLYKLSTDDLVQGILKTRRLGDAMTPNDMFAIGTRAANFSGEEFLARQYLQHALTAIRTTPDRLGEVSESLVLMEITRLCEKMRDYKCAALHLKEFMMREPQNEAAAEYAMKIVKLFQTHGNAQILAQDDPFAPTFERDGRYTRAKEFELMSETCRGAHENDGRASTLRCRYSSFRAPFLRFKVEEVNREPLIELYVDALSDDEIQSLKKITTAATATGADEKSIYDAARVAWLYDKDRELVARISRRIEAMTGLSVDTSEPLIVQNFGAAGPAIWQQQERRGRKIASILFFMNDDHMDGYTAFPYLKLRVKPREGSALFWFTLKHSGASEHGTRFTQCPVLNKSKWIAFKNLYEHGQEFRRPCRLVRDEETDIEDYDKMLF